ncbi:hypothetical protein AGMMS49944_07930 [Spirochaetia bacterium]|nr:hypothetical protein AGMMS49944_07930 [Spirochaetia bacterium]
MKRIILSFFLFSALCSLHVGAEDAKPLIRLMPLIIEGLGPEEARFLSTLVQSYVTDIGELDLPSGESPTTPDFILTGSITVDQDSRVLAIEIVKSETGETVYHTSTHKTTSDLTLKVRSLVEAAFSSGTIPGETRGEIITDGKILGTWRGDAGLEIVRIQGGGTAMAILSSGAQMNFVYIIENNTLKLTQTSPNRARFYHPAPFEVARELSLRAEPWRYELFLSNNGAVLRGIKISTGVSYGDDGTVEFIPDSIREAEWTKSAR